MPGISLPQANLGQGPHQGVSRTDLRSDRCLEPIWGHADEPCASSKCRLSVPRGVTDHQRVLRRDTE
jgi:hypothetical protein